MHHYKKIALWALVFGVVITSVLVAKSMMQGQSTPFDPSDAELQCYLNMYPDLKKAFGTNIDKARAHWFQHGAAEGRIAHCPRTTGSPTPLTDDEASRYLKAYVDLKKAFGDNVGAANNHWMFNGYKEGRVVPAPAYYDRRPNSLFVLSGKSQKYCATVPGGKISCNTTTTTEPFEVEDLGDGKMALKSSTTQKYCADEKDNVICNRDAVGGWEKFAFQKIGLNKFTLRGGQFGKYCSDDGTKVVCNRPEPRGWETFSFVAASPSSTTQAPTTVPPPPPPPPCPLECHVGWKNIGGTCYENCPSGWTDFGFTCTGRNRKGQLATRKKKAMARKCLNPPPVVAPPATTTTTIADTTTLPEGASVRCDGGDGKIYRHMNGTLYHYPNPAIADSWNPNWAQNILNISATDCARLPVGPPLFEKRADIQPGSNTVPPPTTVVPEVQAPTTVPPPPPPPPCPLECHVGWKNIGGTCYENCPSGWTDFGFTCTGRNSKGQLATRKKKAMARKCLNPPPVVAPPATTTTTIADTTTLPEGASVRCDGGDGKIYRHMNGTLYHYPNPAIADSWNPNWAQNILNISATDCARLPVGPPLFEKRADIQPGSNTVPPPTTIADTATDTIADTTITDITDTITTDITMSSTTAGQQQNTEASNMMPVAIVAGTAGTIGIIGMVYYLRLKRMNT